MVWSFSTSYVPHPWTLIWLFLARGYRPPTSSTLKPIPKNRNEPEPEPVDLGWEPEGPRATKKGKRKALHSDAHEAELETQLKAQGEEAKVRLILLS